ncbi:cysteine hydrolase family protein [Gottfriedia luciferensis]|uniref:cysteine hydrolase family protein n=1 Tax=Gottfriedia luciferensis TaxID=178774 RepID=UPI000B444D93|nr:isochorismatase family protein [Gottfriedia luciferensis]
MKSAFLIIDMQKNLLQDQEEVMNVESACEYINHVADLFRAKNHLVIHVQDMEGANEDNSESYSIIPEINVLEQDLCITKEHSNAFWDTKLEQILHENGVNLIVIAGFAAEHCVLFTYNGANERGFNAVILQHGILSTKSDVITQTYRDRNIVSYKVIPYLSE